MKRRLAIMKAARGNVELSITIVTRPRSIPARAGETAEVVFCQGVLFSFRRLFRVVVLAVRH